MADRESPWVILSMVAFFLVFIGVVLLALTQARQEKRAWEAFAKSHDCRVVERMRGDVDTTVAPIFDGKGGVSTAVGVTSTADKTAYLCNDGVKYWR
jgi:uncharacterized membrane protein